MLVITTTEGHEYRFVYKMYPSGKYAIYRVTNTDYWHVAANIEEWWEQHKQYNVNAVYYLG